MGEKLDQTRPFDKPGFEDLPIAPDLPRRTATRSLIGLSCPRKDKLSLSFAVMDDRRNISPDLRIAESEFF
jgi:hypothetical protein